MTTLLLKVPVDDTGGPAVEIEVDSADLDPRERERLLGSGPDLVNAAFTLSSSLDTVMPALSMILHRLQTAARSPDEIGIELGLKVGGETGLIIAKGTAEATFKVVLTWKRPVPVLAPATAPHADGARTPHAG